MLLPSRTHFLFFTQMSARPYVSLFAQASAVLNLSNLVGFVDNPSCTTSRVSTELSASCFCVFTAHEVPFILSPLSSSVGLLSLSPSMQLAESPWVLLHVGLGFFSSDVRSTVSHCAAQFSIEIILVFLLLDLPPIPVHPPTLLQLYLIQSLCCDGPNVFPSLDVHRVCRHFLCFLFLHHVVLPPDIRKHRVAGSSFTWLLSTFFVGHNKCHKRVNVSLFQHSPDHRLVLVL